MTLLEPKSIRRISYIVEFLLVFNFSEFFIGILIYMWNFDITNRTVSSDWLSFTNAFITQDLPITSRLCILLGSAGFVIIGCIGLSLYFGQQRERWIGCFIGVLVGGSAFFVARILIRNNYPLYSVISFFILQSFSFIILNVFILQLNLFGNLKTFKKWLKGIIILGNCLIQIVFPILLVLDESGYGMKLALIVGWICSIGGYCYGRYLSIFTNSPQNEEMNLLLNDPGSEDDN
jgi:hypothetical protein